MSKNWVEHGKPEPQAYAGSPEGVETSLVSHTSNFRDAGGGLASFITELNIYLAWESEQS